MQLREYIENTNSPLKNQILTLCDAVELLEKKLRENFEKYETAPLSIEVVKGDGQILCRTNPFVEEYRNTLKDYQNALIKLQELTKVKVEKTDIKSIDQLRSKFKIVNSN